MTTRVVVACGLFFIAGFLWRGLWSEPPPPPAPTPSTLPAVVCAAPEPASSPRPTPRADHMPTASPSATSVVSAAAEDRAPELRTCVEGGGYAGAHFYVRIDRRGTEIDVSTSGAEFLSPTERSCVQRLTRQWIRQRRGGEPTGPLVLEVTL